MLLQNFQQKQIIIIASVIMIEANKIIFPSPKQDLDRQKLLTSIKPNIIYVPKQQQPANGCLCQSFLCTYPSPPSSITTARTQQSDSTTRTIKIQSSKQLQLKVMKAKNKRSDTKIINIVSGRGSNTDQNTQNNLNTVRTAFPEKKKQEANRNSRINLAKNRSRFLSDDLYQQENDDEFEGGQKVQTVRIFNKIHNRLTLQACRTSRLWNYQNYESEETVIPCLYFQSGQFSDKIMLYFHGNGEDLTGCHTFLKQLCAYTQISVLAVEYPGYSLYQGSPCSDSIESDGREVVQFLKHQIGFDVGNIMVVGRSIGSGPALHVSSVYSVGGLVLLSPFLSLCQAVNDLYGNLASGLLKQRFDNKERAKEVESPCLIVHGTKDKLISQKHAIQLSQYFRGFCMTKIVKEMSHSVFSHQQFFAYVSDFQQAIQFVI